MKCAPHSSPAQFVNCAKCARPPKGRGARTTFAEVRTAQFGARSSMGADLTALGRSLFRPELEHQRAARVDAVLAALLDGLDDEAVRFASYALRKLSGRLGEELVREIRADLTGATGRGNPDKQGGLRGSLPGVGERRSPHGGESGTLHRKVIRPASWAGREVTRDNPQG